MSEIEPGRTVPANSHLPSRIQRRGQHLLSQQCWLWGQDVKRAEGNLLLAFGFERLRPPEGASGSTQYTLHISSGFLVRLWGFGMYFGGDQGVHVNRYEFVARSAEFKEGWQGADFTSSLPRSSEFHLLAQAAGWVAVYESWVLKTAGLSYRQHALQGWKKSVCKVADIPTFWHQLSRDIHLQSQRPTRGPRGALHDQRHAAHLPYTKNTRPAARNPRRSLDFTLTSHPASSKDLPQSLHWKC